MNFFSPIFRSRRYGHRQLNAGRIVIIGAITWLTPAVVGGMLIVLATLFDPELSADGPLAVLTTVAGLTLLSPIYGIFAVPMGLLLGAWFMRWGIAGWGSAVFVSLVLPGSLGGIVQLLDPTTTALGAMLVLTPIIFIHAAIMWIATRTFCPDALLEAPESVAS